MGGKEGDNQPDKAVLSFDVKVGDDTVDLTPIPVAIAIIVAVAIIVFVVMAIASALVAMAIRKKRGEEHERKAEVKKGADKAEAKIDFHMDADDSMADLETGDYKMKAERDRLKDENEELAADVGEEAMVCADTADPDVLVTQIKSLKGENDRLRDR